MKKSNAYWTTGGRGPDPRLYHDHRPASTAPPGELGIAVQYCACGWQRKFATETGELGEWGPP